MFKNGTIAIAKEKSLSPLLIWLFVMVYQKTEFTQSSSDMEKTPSQKILSKLRDLEILLIIILAIILIKGLTNFYK